MLDGFRDMKSTSGAGQHQNTATAATNSPSAQSPHDTVSSKSTPEHTSDCARRKKRKLGNDENNTRGMPNGASIRNGVSSSSVAKNLAATDPSPPHPILDASSASPDVPLRLGYPHQSRTPYRTPRRPPLVNLLKSNATPGPSRSVLPSTAQGRASTHPTNFEPLTTSMHAPRMSGGLLKFNGNTTSTLALPKPPLLVPGTPKNADSLASTTSTLSQSSVARHGSAKAVACDPGQQIKTAAIRFPSAATVYSSLVLVTPARQGLQHNLAPSGNAHLLRTTAPGSSATPVATKLLSIKDVRALTATPAFVSVLDTPRFCCR